MKKLYTFLLVVLAITSCSNKEQQPKYIFYFIGDGMGFSHVSIAEKYLHYLENDGAIGNQCLSFSEFPVLGMASTYSASNNITCSSAAGTALSCGVKTNNGFLGVAPDSSAIYSMSDPNTVASSLQKLEKSANKVLTRFIDDLVALG